MRSPDRFSEEKSAGSAYENCATASGFELRLGGAGEAVGRDIKLHASDIAVAENLDELALADETTGNKSLNANRATFGEHTGDVAQVHRLVLGTESVLEPAKLRQPYVERRLPTLKAGWHIL